MKNKLRRGASDPPIQRSCCWQAFLPGRVFDARDGWRAPPCVYLVWCGIRPCNIPFSLGAWNEIPPLFRLGQWPAGPPSDQDSRLDRNANRLQRGLKLHYGVRWLHWSYTASEAARNNVSFFWITLFLRWTRNAVDQLQILGSEGIMSRLTTHTCVVTPYSLSTSEFFVIFKTPSEDILFVFWVDCGLEKRVSLSFETRSFQWVHLVSYRFWRLSLLLCSWHSKLCDFAEVDLVSAVFFITRLQHWKLKRKRNERKFLLPWFSSELTKLWHHHVKREI